MAVYNIDGTAVSLYYDANGKRSSAAYDVGGDVVARNLRVMEYNVGAWYIGSGTNVPADKDAEYYALQNGIIKGQDADVLAICEYWGVFSKTGRTALPMLEQYYPYIEKYNVDATYLGRAICSKYPIVSYTPHTFTGESRYYDDAVINYAGENIHVIVTHFHPSETPTKIAEAKQLFNYVSALTEKFIICGDFNSTLYDPFSETNAAIYNQFLNAGCTLANDGVFGIFPTACNSDDWATDKFAIDNIIASGGITITDVWTDLTKTTDGITDGKIDHIPLIAELSVS